MKNKITSPREFALNTSLFIAYLDKVKKVFKETHNIILGKKELINYTKNYCSEYSENEFCNRILIDTINEYFEDNGDLKSFKGEDNE